MFIALYRSIKQRQELFHLAPSGCVVSHPCHQMLLVSLASSLMLPSFLGHEQLDSGLDISIRFGQGSLGILSFIEAELSQLAQQRIPRLIPQGELWLLVASRELLELLLELLQLILAQVAQGLRAAAVPGLLVLHAPLAKPAVGGLLGSAM